MTAPSEKAAAPSASTETDLLTGQNDSTPPVEARWKDDDRDDGGPEAVTTSNGVTMVDDEESTSEESDTSEVAAGPSTVSRRSWRGRRQRFEARKVHRLVRHIDPWSLAKFSLVFFLAMWIMMMVAALIVWNIAERADTIGNIESFFQDLGFKDVSIDGTFYVRGLGLVGLVLTFALSAGSIVAAMVFNLISDIIGGVWITVIEEESARAVSGSPDDSDVG